MTRWSVIALPILLFGCGTAEEVGGECRHHGECESGTCLAARMHLRSTGWTDGYCTADCAADACPSGSLCREVDDGRLCLARCGDGAGCREGYVCEAGACLPACGRQRGCGGRICGEDGVCRAPTDVGEACEDAGTCDGGVCLTDDGWTDGHCSAACEEDDACGEGGACRRLQGQGTCLAACDGPTACRAGYVCSPAWAACLPDCRDGWDCGETLDCRRDGLCGPPPGDAEIGEVCEAPPDCVSGHCFPEGAEGSETGWAGGYCVAPCFSDSECPDGAGCWPLLPGRFCLDGCGGAADCRDGYVCDPDWDVCLPDCRLGWSCGAGRCDPDGVCQNECERQCDGLMCGPDGCGGQCGQCRPDDTCEQGRGRGGGGPAAATVAGHAGLQLVETGICRGLTCSFFGRLTVRTPFS